MAYQVRAAVSGSFRKHMLEIAKAVEDLQARDVEVVSPADPTIVDSVGEFLFVASDKVRSVRLVQDRHLEAIRSADFLWLVCPEGYVGQSASMELGYAAAVGTPVFSTHKPDDLTLSQYVHQVLGLQQVMNIVEAWHSEPTPSSAFVLDPVTSLRAAHDRLEGIHAELRRPASEINERVEMRIARLGDSVRSLLPRTLRQVPR